MLWPVYGYEGRAKGFSGCANLSTLIKDRSRSGKIIAQFASFASGFVDLWKRRWYGGHRPKCSLTPKGIGEPGALHAIISDVPAQITTLNKDKE
jgi:hypothetical protein